MPLLPLLLLSAVFFKFVLVSIHTNTIDIDIDLGRLADIRVFVIIFYFSI